MKPRLRQQSPFVLVACLVAIGIFVAGDAARGQLVPEPPATGTAKGGASLGAQTGAEALLRGPLHEAFAEQIDISAAAAVVVPKKPPAPIEEVPPAVRPEGSNVAWIPGYWAWNAEGQDFDWVSGGWRKPPPGRRWVPGYWQEADSGYRWVAGTWVEADARTLAYLPPPPESLEKGPASPAASDLDIWVPGCWVYEDAQYRWRPGFWGQSQADWIWIPDHYVWTPAGVIFVAGYWDYRLADRGVLFAPVAFGAGAGVSVRFTPGVVIDLDRVYVHLFIAPGFHHYYFGDYYGDAYVAMGIYPWFQFQTGARGYDPLLPYYAWSNSRSGVDLVARLGGWHAYYLAKAELRPPHTLADVAAFANVHAGSAYLDQSILGQPLPALHAKAGAGLRVPLVHLSDAQVSAIVGDIAQVHALAGQRLKVETSVPGVARLDTAAAASVQAPGISLDLPAVTSPLGIPSVRAGVAAPGVRVPGVRTPDVRVPGVKVPGVRTPGVNVPGVRVPGIRTPGIRADEGGGGIGLFD